MEGVKARPSRLKRLFELQFSAVLRGSSASERVAIVTPPSEPGPGSVALDKMVMSFIEDGGAERNAQPAAVPVRNRCNCFNRNANDDGSGDESEDPPPLPPSEVLKGLVPCVSLTERNLLADASKILERTKNLKNKTDCRRVVLDGLKSLGYDAAICKSRWDRTASFPSGEHEYIDVVIVGEGGDDGNRIIVEVDLKGEFEIARSTKAYRAALQALPVVYVGSAERLTQIVDVVAEAAKQSLQKKGLHFPPWRKPEYMRAKWLSPFARSGDGDGHASLSPTEPAVSENKSTVLVARRSAPTVGICFDVPKAKSAVGSQFLNIPKAKLGTVGVKFEAAVNFAKVIDFDVAGKKIPDDPTVNKEIDVDTASCVTSQSFEVQITDPNPSAASGVTEEERFTVTVWPKPRPAVTSGLAAVL